jgi:hypothetical protein
LGAATRDPTGFKRQLKYQISQRLSQTLKSGITMTIPIVNSTIEHQVIKTPSVFVFSIATNDFDVFFRRCLQSHKVYADRQGYRYQLIIPPRPTDKGDRIGWLKIPMVLAALEKGYDWVMFLDADCEVTDRAPRVESIEQPDKSLYLALGHTKRVNSGVILVKNSPESREFFRTVLANAEEPVPTDGFPPFPYENGHMIHYSRSFDGLELLDQRWNNNVDLELADYVRHYSGGEMRSGYQPPRFHKAEVKIRQWMRKVSRRLMGEKTIVVPKEFRDRLTQLTELCEGQIPSR